MKKEKSLENESVIKKKGEVIEGTRRQDDYEPITEIVIHIGDSKRNTLFPVRVYVNGEKIEHLRGFGFEAHIDEPPVMKIEKIPY